MTVDEAEKIIALWKHTPLKDIPDNMREKMSEAILKLIETYQLNFTKIIKDV